MIRLRLPLVCLALLLASTASRTDAVEVDVYFSPNGGLAQAIAAEIDAAKISIDVMSFTISEPKICAAICRANDRGIRTRLIVNSTQEASRSSRAASLYDYGIIVRTDKRHSRMHNKVVIIDARIVCTGSANHSKSGDKSNAENLVIIRCVDVAATFTANFMHHWNHSIRFEDRTKKRH